MGNNCQNQTKTIKPTGLQYYILTRLVSLFCKLSFALQWLIGCVYLHKTAFRNNPLTNAQVTFFFFFRAIRLIVCKINIEIPFFYWQYRSNDFEYPNSREWERVFFIIHWKSLTTAFYYMTQTIQLNALLSNEEVFF